MNLNLTKSQKNVLKNFKFYQENDKLEANKNEPKTKTKDETSPSPNKVKTKSNKTKISNKSNLTRAQDIMHYVINNQGLEKLYL